jgi:hypothetical protein
MKTIEIKCKGSSLAQINDLVPFQGNLKDLSEENYKKLRKEILELGFSEPVSVWEHDGVLKILNGHQRLKTLKMMRDEGFEIPPIPISFIQAKDDEEAKKKILALTSQYGNITSHGLREFMGDSGLDFSDISSSFSFPEINMGIFEVEYLKDVNPPVQEGITDPLEEWKGMPEFTQEDKTAYKTVILHFSDQEAVDNFSTLIDQPITDKTRTLWYPLVYFSLL